jgi:prepilin-type N-terminal cleavage/methylation domain-containing protein
MRMSRRRAFTLIEMITVIAISAVLLSIITVPLFTSFSATRDAQAYSDAQDKARQLTTRLTREIADAVSVRDNDSVGGRVTIVIPVPTRGVDESGAQVTTPGGFQPIGLNYTKLDLVLPAREGDRAGAAYIDPNTGKIDPTLRAPKGQIKLPLAPGNTIRRYWIGLRDPFANYNNPYDALLMSRNGGRDNLFVLYMAEVEPLVNGVAGAVVNAAFFDADPADATGRTPLYDAPDFFLADGAVTGAPIGTGTKADRIRNWQNRAEIVTELSRYDLIQPIFDKATRLVTMTNEAGTYAPRISPLISFRPSQVDGEGTNAQVALPMGSESEGGDAIGSEIYQTQFGLWSSYNVRSYNDKWIPGLPYQIGKTDPATREFKLHFITPAPGVIDKAPGVGLEVFNVSAYQKAVAANVRYPFTVGFNGVAPWLGAASPAQLATFTPYSISPARGKVFMSFPISSVGNAAVAPGAFDPNDPNASNLPQNRAGRAFTPPAPPTIPPVAPSANVDPDVTTGTFSDAPFWNATDLRWDINRVFNKVWADAQAGPAGVTGPGLVQVGRNNVPRQFGEIGGAHRFIDLRHVPMGDGTPNVLGLFPKAQIVPGTDEVYGPDQNPGANFGFEVRYRRVTTKEPGPNEYRINYSNLSEPNLAGYNLLGLNLPPLNYTRTNFESAIVQPRYKAGYIQLCSNPEVPIPDQMFVNGNTANVVPGRIRVAYKFQFTTAKDVVRVEYDTRQLMSILVTIRNYPQSATPNPQVVTMKATANVRNFIR